MIVDCAIHLYIGLVLFSFIPFSLFYLLSLLTLSSYYLLNYYVLVPQSTFELLFTVLLTTSLSDAKNIKQEVRLSPTAVAINFTYENAFHPCIN